MKIPEPLIERIRDAARITDVAGDFVALRKKGVNYVGVCPVLTEQQKARTRFYLVRSIPAGSACAHIPPSLAASKSKTVKSNSKLFHTN